jgi:hypothetical protein
VALFGRNNVLKQPAEIEGFWGVKDERLPGSFVIPRERQDATEMFLRWAPLTNKPSLKKVTRDEQDVLEPTASHYEMNTYLNHFRIETESDSHGKVVKIYLRCVSQLDPRVVLTERQWAVTLVSTPHCSDSFWKKLFETYIGHAMLAIESVENGRYQLRYVHCTNAPPQEERHPKFDPGDHGQLVCLPPSQRSKETINGPTWMRSKELVENLLKYVADEKGKLREFSMTTSGWWANMKQNSFRGLAGHFWKNEAWNCLKSAYVVAEQAGIFFVEKGSITPISQVEILQKVAGFPIFTVKEILGTRIDDKTQTRNSDEFGFVPFNIDREEHVILTEPFCSPAEAQLMADQIQLRREWLNRRPPNYFFSRFLVHLNRMALEKVKAAGYTGVDLS